MLKAMRYGHASRMLRSSYEPRGQKVTEEPGGSSVPRLTGNGPSLNSVYFNAEIPRYADGSHDA